MARLSKSGTKPKLQDLYEIFGLSGKETEDKTNNTNVKNKVVYIEIKKLKPFNNHLFRLYEGERLDDMVSSIKINGVLVPIIARKVDKILEILSGHNRVNASKIAGLTVVPTIILESISDDEADVLANLSLGNPCIEQDMLDEMIDGFCLIKGKNITDLDYVINSSASNLSGGELQKISLIRTLVSGKSILVFDEPTTFLDSHSKKYFIEKIAQLKQFCIIIIVTHDDDLVSSLDSIIKI